MLKPAIDPKSISALRDLVTENHPHFVREYFELFLNTTPEKIEGIRMALENLDFAKLEADAHTLKSNCAYTGAHNMADICGRLESLGKEKSFAEGTELFADLVQEFELVRKEISLLPEMK